MPIEGNLDYALARVHARHGQRLEEADWRRLEANRDLALYLAALRSTALVDWVSSLDTEHDCHTFERMLRVQWQRYVDAVAAWHPLAYQAWLAWLAWLPGLSLLARLARPDPAPAWMLADPVYGPLAPGTPAERAVALADTALAPMESVLAGRTSAAAAWSTHWQVLRPRFDTRAQRCLELFVEVVRRHEENLARAVDSAGPLRSDLAHQFQRLLRVAAGTVIVTLCHIALVALEIERLRGGLARRRLFPAGQAEHR
jgi:hypothetical protein